MNKTGRSVLFAALLTLAVPLWASAQEAQPAPAAPTAPAAPVEWSKLSPQQQQVLSKFGSQWSTLPPERQQALARGSERWLGMSPEQRDQARERFSALPRPAPGAASGAAWPLAAVPDATAGAARLHAPEFPSLPATAAGAPPGAARAMAQCHPRTALADDRARPPATAAPEAATPLKGSAGPRRMPAPSPGKALRVRRHTCRRVCTSHRAGTCMWNRTYRWVHTRKSSQACWRRRWLRSNSNQGPWRQSSFDAPVNW